MKDNPLVSYCLFTFNQEAYVRESLEAALAQTYSPLEIVISDDCSTDGTVAVIQEVLSAYSGEHRIVLNVNEKNMGIGGHVSKILLELSSGDYFVLVGGDDISSPNHVQVAVETIQPHPNVYAADFSASVIDEAGKIIQEDNSPDEAYRYRLADFIGLNQRVPTFAPGRIIHRDLMHKFLPIATSCPTEDTVLVLRSLLLGELRREPINLIQYRRAANSVSSLDNIKKLSVSGIMNQYYADIEYAEQAQLIDTSQAIRLKRRIEFEHKKRELYLQNQGGWFGRVFVKVKFRMLKYRYKLKLLIGGLL